MDSMHRDMTTLPDGPWSVARGENDGRPLLVRVNTGAAAAAKQIALAHRVGIAVLLHAPDSSGFPASDESATLSKIEDAIEAELRVGHDTILVVVLTTGGMREFLLYSAIPQDTESAVARVQAQFPNYEIQFYVQPDPDWDGYLSFTDAL